MKEVFLSLSIFVFSLSILVLGCASKSTTEDPEEDSSHSELYKEKQKEFADCNPMIVSKIGGLELTIRMATLAEIPKDDYKMWLIFPTEGAGSLALGLVAPPMYASALVVGGAFLLPLGTYGYLHDKRVWDSISTALSEAELTRIIDKLLKDKLKIVFTKEAAPNVNIEIIIQAFGINSTMRPACFMLSADFLVSRGNTEMTREQLNITNVLRSKDAPPPQCASLEHFAENEARLVKETLNEYAEVLTVMAIDRIPRGNAK